MAGGGVGAGGGAGGRTRPPAPFAAGGGERDTQALHFDDLLTGAGTPGEPVPDEQPDQQRGEQHPEQAEETGVATQRAKRTGRIGRRLIAGGGGRAEDRRRGRPRLGLEHVEEGEAHGRGGTPAGEAVALVGGERGAAPGAGSGGRAWAPSSVDVGRGITSMGASTRTSPEGPADVVAGAGGAGLLEDLRGGAVLDEVAEVHEGDLVSDAAGLGEVVGDDHDREIAAQLDGSAPR